MPARSERIYIVPRLSGLVLAVFVLLVLGAGYAFEGVEQESRLLGLSLFAVGLVVLFQTNANLRGLEVVECASPPVAEGDAVEVSIRLVNRSHLLHAGVGVRALPKSNGHRFLPAIEAGAARTLSLLLPPLQRGIHPVPDVRVSSVRPAGLCYAWKIFRPSGELVVIPRPEGEPLAALLARRTGSGDLSEVRPGRPGDPPSRTDWKILARTGRWMVRESEDASESVRFGWRDTAHLADVQARLRQLSKWVAEAQRHGLPFALDMGNGCPVVSHAAACRELAAHPG